MKKQILSALLLTSLSAGAFALPPSLPQPLLGESRDSSLQTLENLGLKTLAEGGAERLRQRLKVAEDGADRVGRNRIAEGGAELTLSKRSV